MNHNDITITSICIALKGYLFILYLYKMGGLSLKGLSQQHHVNSVVKKKAQSNMKISFL